MDLYTIITELSIYINWSKLQDKGTQTVSFIMCLLDMRFIYEHYLSKKNMWVSIIKMYTTNHNPNFLR